MILLDSVVEAAKRLPPDQGGALLLGVIDYSERCVAAEATAGVAEPFEEDAVLGAVFGGMKFAIDRALSKQINGARGGEERARRAKAERERAESEPKANGKRTPSEPEAKSKPAPSELQPKDKDKDKDTASSEASTPKPPYAAIVGYLNERCGTRYRHRAEKTRRLIDARFREGFGEEDFRAVIDGRAAAWLGDEDMAQYLRPETLFGTKFEGYLNARCPKRGGGRRVDLGRYSKPEGEAF